MEVQCIHSCRGLCNALTVAEHREQSTIKEYQTYLDQCNYPDVQAILRELIGQHEKVLGMLRDKRAELEEKFKILDSINESFA